MLKIYRPRHTTVFIYLYFSITYNLREIDFGDSGSAKSTVLTHLDAVNLASLHFSHFLKAEIYQNIRI